VGAKKARGDGRPGRSPAVMIAILVLGAALTGTAIAGPDVISSGLNTSKVKKIARGQANKQIKKRVLTAEPYHRVGAPGEPGFQNGWVNYTGQPNFATAAFYKDRLGVVHLRGSVDGGTNNAIFTLPPGYRPARNLVAVIHRFSGPASMIIRADGGVAPLLGSGNASLDGVTFRAGS